MKQHYLRLLVLLLTVPLFTAAHAAQYTYDKLHRLTAVTYDSGDNAVTCAVGCCRRRRRINRDE